MDEDKGSENGAKRLSKIKTPEDLAKMIEHTSVKGDVTQDDVKKLCDEAIKYNFASAVVTATNVSLASSLLLESEVNVCSVVGFPLGVSTPETKAFETAEAISNGADEIDMVMNIGAIKSGLEDLLEKDISAVVEAASGKVVKVILETALLTEEEKIISCLISEKAGADYVKTSTAYGGLSGATVEDVKLMRKTVSPNIKIKAAGGIRDLDTALAMIEAGADKLGTSTGVQIIEEMIKKNDTILL
jgi:deoxyribose-phosphate aldolase